MTTAAAAEKIVLHCFTCRARTDWERILASRPVFKCKGCGNTKEVEELGRVDIPGQASPVPAPRPRPQLPPLVSPKKRTYTNRRKETKIMPKDRAVPPLRQFVEKIIAESKERPGDALTREDVEEIVDARITAMLGLAENPSNKAKSSADFVCPRAPHKGRHGKKCHEAAAK
jgi:hypothetical protein